MLSWRSDPEDTSIQGYSVRFHPSSSSHFLFQEEPGLNRSQVLVEGLRPATEYSFALQAYNNQGRSSFTPPSVAVTMLGVVEEAASSSSSSMGGGSQQRVPRLILIIICLTGAALLILNIVIVSCFLRRYVFKKNSANARKPTTYSVYTPSTTPGSTTYGDLMSLNPSVPPPEYQVRFLMYRRTLTPESPGDQHTIPCLPYLECVPTDLYLDVRRDTDSEGTSTNTLRASFESPQKSTEPLCVQVLNVSEEGATSLEGPASSQEDPYPQTRVAPPQIHVTPPHAHATHTHEEQRRASDGSVVSTKSTAPTKQEQCAYSDASCSRVVNPSSFGEFTEQESLGVRSVCQSSNIPDVCPTTLTSYETMLPPRQVPSCQEVIPEFPEDEEEEEQEGDIKDVNVKSTAVHEGSNTQYTSCQKHVPGSRFVDSPDSSPCRASVVQHHSDTPPTPRHNPATTARPSSQVIFHGQPHIQQQYEEQRLQQDVQQNTHPAQYTCPCYQQEPQHPLHHASQPSYPHDPQYQQHFKKYTAHQVLDHPLQPLHHPQSFYSHGEDSEDLRQHEKEPRLRSQVECHPDFEHPSQRPSSHPIHRPPPHHQKEVSPSYRHVEASHELHQLDVHPQYHQYSPHYPSHCPQGAHQVQHSVQQEPSGVLDPSGLYSLQTNCCEERCGLSSVAESLPATELALCGQDLHSTT
ncbi:uncharacterized protein LOC125045350 [Penaeus chinensis]|uniref:uncharacterized protein LOC125045350 n=1 Tax=Penaeus chinensis TaxID=139456 RepID=UPI001FB6010D|nr:uncharacterized protein LOC125045350 [Penaeus chinensis]